MNAFFKFLNDEYELRKEQYSFIEDKLLALFIVILLCKEIALEII